MRIRIVLLGPLAAAARASAALAATLPAPTTHSLSSNRRAATQDARRRLHSLRLPAAAVPLVGGSFLGALEQIVGLSLTR